ncbi:MAG: sensor domain-containing diguanylate cyclase [Spirochaetia bacterium]|nr:sensor domain-containing diguanylate cyclase [Spirochaetia bacterium]
MNRTVFDAFFYRNNTNITFKFFNTVLVVFGIAAAVFFSVSNGPVPIAAGLVLVIYAFFTMGKEGGLWAAIVYCLAAMILIFIPKGMEKTPYAVIACVGLYIAWHFERLLQRLEDQERRIYITEGELEGSMAETVQKLEKTKNAISSAMVRMENYRMLNKAIEGLISTLDRREIVRIINSTMTKIIGTKPFKATLLIKNEDTDVYHPAVEESREDQPVRGAISIYHKDPFDEWIIKNKYTLIIKNIDDDVRFRNLRKDWIAFKSLIAMPLFENTKIIGILKVYSNEVEAFDSEDVRMLNYLADFLAATVENSMLYQRTKDLATRDGLTGLFIRRYFIEQLDEEIKRSKHTESPFAYIMIDIDHFKDCNDTYGHQFGDKVLRMLGGFLKESLRDVDIVGRYGGEEFAVILPNTNMNGARFVADRLRKSFSKLIINVNEEKGIKLTLSMGGVVYDKSLKLMEVINRADKALYYSKENGRNRVTFWEEITDEG